MKFALRYIFKIFGNSFRFGKAFLVFLALGGFLLGVAVMAFRRGTAERIFDPLIFAMWGAVIYVIFVSACTGFEFTQNYEIQKILNDKGVCSEYLYAYADKNIKNKPHTDNSCIFYASALSRFGQWEEAIRVLLTVDTSKLDLTHMTVYLLTYMLTAVRMEAPAIADKVWVNNHNFIITNVNKPYFGTNTSILYYAMAVVDCAAGRYNRAYETCIKYMNSSWFKANRGINMDFITLKMYLEKHFGLERELTETIALWDKRFKKCRFFYDYDRNVAIKDREKVLNGILPV